MEHWYAVYTRPRFEKKVKQALEEKGEEVFLPLITKIRQWKDRKKKVDMPLFPSYLFLRFDFRRRFDILPTKGIVKIVNFKGVPAIVPDWEIASLKKMMEHPKTLQLENYIRPGELVEVIDGPFKGMHGSVKVLRGQERLLLSIEGIMQTVSVEISSGMVKRLSGKEVK